MPKRNVDVTDRFFLRHRGGMLVLEEVTTELARVPLVVGVLQGWWAGTFQFRGINKKVGH